MASLRSYIAERRAEILREIDVLQAELKDLEKAEAALSEPKAPEPPLPRRPSTLKAMALAVLRSDHSLGLDANTLRREMERTFDVKIERSSLSPQLSRLRREGILVLEGKTWRRTGNLNKEARYLPPPKGNEPSSNELDGSDTRSKGGSQPPQEHVNQSPQDTSEGGEGDLATHC